MILTIIAFLLVFGILVFVHELGHFLAARFFGVRVEEFAFGFPPKIWSKKRGHTTYAINAIPIGGYVKLFGEAGEGKNKADSYSHKKPWQRIIILFAGVFLNLVLAWLLLVAFYIVGGKPILPNMENYPGVSDGRMVEITKVTEATPASLAGIESGSKIVAINGVEIKQSFAVFSEVSKTKEVDDIKKINLQVEKDGKVSDYLLATYKEEVDVNGQNVVVDRIGIEMSESGSIKSAWYLAPYVALLSGADIVKLNVVGLYDFFRNIFVKGALSENVGGPIAIAQLSGGALRLGFGVFIQFIAILSIAVAILNILPIPALDGGHILFILIESVIKRPVSDRFKNSVNLVGFGLLLLLMIAVTVGDVSRLGLLEKIKEIIK